MLASQMSSINCSLCSNFFGKASATFYRTGSQMTGLDYGIVAAVAPAQPFDAIAPTVFINHTKPAKNLPLQIKCFWSIPLLCPDLLNALMATETRYISSG